MTIQELFDQLEVMGGALTQLTFEGDDGTPTGYVLVANDPETIADIKAAVAELEARWEQAVEE